VTGGERTAGRLRGRTTTAFDWKPLRAFEPRRHDVAEAGRVSIPLGLPGHPPAASGAAAPQTGLSAPAKGFLFGLLGLAAISAGAALSGFDAGSVSWPLFATLGALCALAQLFVVRIGRNQSYHTAITFLLVGALTLPPALLPVLVVAMHVPDWVKARYPWYIQSFNIANYTLTALAAWGVMTVTEQVAPADAEPRATLAAAAAAAVFVVCNHGLLSVMLRLARGLTFRRSGLFGGVALTTDLVLAGVAPVLVTVWEANPLLLGAAAAPLLLVHRSFAVPKLREEREREEALRAAELHYRLLVEQLPLATYILAPDYTVLYVSPQIEAMLNCSPKDAVDEDEFWTERLHPDDREAIPAAWRAALEEGKPFRAEYRMVTAEGRTVWVQDEAVAARDAAGATVYFQGYLLDITERKTAEVELSLLSRQNELLLRSVGEGIFGLDPQGRVTFANPAGVSLTGFTLEELLGRDLHEVIAHRDEDGAHCSDVRRVLTATLRDRAEHHFEDEIHRLSDGRTYPAECTTTPVRQGDELVGAVLVLRDISERKELEQQLRQAQKLEAIGKLAGGVAHDFNNLLTAIGGHSELALAALGDHPVRANVGEVKRAVERASGLTQQLLAFSRKQVLQPRVLNLNAVVCDVESLLGPLIHEDIVLVQRLDPALAPVRADQCQLEQVLVNLAVNARDAMPTGGRLTLETRNVTLDGESARALGLSPGAYVELATSDTGHGMDADTRARIFEPFFTTKEPGRGTGLGLSTVYGIVAQSGGAITVDSSPGAGARFRVYLPQAEEKQAPEEAVAEPPDEPPRATGTVLLVEDDEMVRELTNRLLGRAGFDVLAAADPNEAIAVCAAHDGPIDVLLTDVVMPVMWGPALATRIRALRPFVEVVYASGYNEEVIAKRGILEPGTAFLAKPFSSNQLVASITGALNKATAPWM
jgi:PAS domain S-box-containing protein